MKTRLQYEWKNIYRHLNLIDKSAKGLVTLTEFNEAVARYGAYLSREDLNRVVKLYTS
jgi:hypothetical protein